MRSSSRRASWMTVSRVMPTRMFSVGGGVTSSLFTIRKMFSALPSETWPSAREHDRLVEAV